MVIEKGQYIEQWGLTTKLPPKFLHAAPIPLPDTNGQPGTAYFSNAMHRLKADPKVRAAFKRFVEFLYEPENRGSFLVAAPGLFLPVTVEAAKSRTLMEHLTIKRHREKFEPMIGQAKLWKALWFHAASISSQYRADCGPKPASQGIVPTPPAPAHTSSGREIDRPNSIDLCIATVTSAT